MGKQLEFGTRKASCLIPSLSMPNVKYQKKVNHGTDLLDQSRWPE